MDQRWLTFTCFELQELRQVAGVSADETAAKEKLQSLAGNQAAFTGLFH